MPINRQYMEKEGKINERDYSKTNWIAVDNLNSLNRAVKHGLWNGTVKVFEFGSNALKFTPYEKRPSTTGALLNYYISLGGNIFVGTEISSYSTDLLATRFYRGIFENYKYTPNGVERWTKEGDIKPAAHEC